MKNAGSDRNTAALVSLSCYRQIFLLARYIPSIKARHDSYRHGHGMGTAVN
jgi:hypothetical protein